MAQNLRADDAADHVMEVPAEGPIDESAAEAAAVVGIHLGGALPPLFLIRSWTGEIPGHRRLARYLGDQQPVYSIAPPGGTRLEDYPATTEVWADLSMERLVPIPHEGPYLLGGWSFGGVVALEVAERLTANGERVDLVAMMDTRLPKSHPRTRPGKRKKTKLSKFAARLNQYVALDTREERIAFLRWRFRRRFERLGKKLRKLSRRLLARVLRPGRRERPAEEVFVPPRQKEIMLRVRALRIAYLKYEKKKISVPITQFWTEDSRARAGESSLGWSAFAFGELAGVPTPGTHRTMFDEPHVALLAERLARWLRQAREASAASSESSAAAPLASG